MQPIVTTLGTIVSMYHRYDRPTREHGSIKLKSGFLDNLFGAPIVF